MNGLPTPASDAGRAGLAALLSRPEGALLATDYDGTLAPIVTDPARAYPQPGAVEVLARVAAQVGTVAVITGRPAATAVELGGLRVVPGLIVLGGYGAQRWQHGEVQTMVAAPQPAVTATAVSAVRELVERLGPAGTTIELKGAAVAVHVRETADPVAAQAALTRPLVVLAESYGLAVEPGRKVIELRPPGTDKGEALAVLVDELDLRTVVFIGDDLGDLAAFAAVGSLRERGLCGLTVASASTEVPEVAEAADLVLQGPPGVVRWLEELTRILERQA